MPTLLWQSASFLFILSNKIHFAGKRALAENSSWSSGGSAREALLAQKRPPSHLCIYFQEVFL